MARSKTNARPAATKPTKNGAKPAANAAATTKRLAKPDAKPATTKLAATKPATKPAATKLATTKPVATKPAAKPLWADEMFDGNIDGYTTTPEALIPQLVGDRMFPGAEHEDLQIHTQFVIQGYTEDYLDRAKTLFQALLAAITEIHGKPESRGPKNKFWEPAGREIHLSFVPNANPGDVQMAEVRLRARPLGSS
jgi:hypothetical protein